MATIIITDKDVNESNMFYIQTGLSEVFMQTESKVLYKEVNGRSALIISCPIICYDIIKAEIDDRCADVIAVNYKYEYFKERIRPEGLSGIERELLLTSIIAADLEDDKRYVLSRLKSESEYAIDGIFNFKLRALKQKWQEIVEYIPKVFVNEQLKDFITYLIEGKSKKVYVDGNKVYDSHYKRLIKNRLIGEKEELPVIKEVILSNCGEIELESKIPKEDEYYLKELYKDRIRVSKKYFS